MSTALARRLGRLEALAEEEARRRLAVAISALAGSMSPEHGRTVGSWIRDQKIMAKRCELAHRDDRFCLRCIEEDKPPALVRAAWVMIFAYVEHETPASLPPDVARVYVEHPDAAPAVPCLGCTYLLPTRRGCLAYTGPCPVCSRVATVGA